MLKIPTQLGLTVLLLSAATGCPHNPEPMDARVDVPTDQGLDVQDVLNALDVLDALNPMDVLGDARDVQAVDGSPQDLVTADQVYRDAQGPTLCDANPQFATESYACIRPTGTGGTTFCSTAFACSPQECPSECEVCPASFGEYGFLCRPSPGTDVTAQCPAERVCTAGECPSGCDACRDVVLCLPDPAADVAVTMCTPQTVCNARDCPSGCYGVVV